jgi:hypothetical protein
MTVILGFDDSFSGVIYLHSSQLQIYTTQLCPKGFFLFKATKEGSLIIVGCMSITTPIKENNKQKPKTHKPFVRSKYSRVFNFNFVVSKVCQKFPKF